MRIMWSPEAIVDLTDLRDYIARDNPRTAHGVAEIIVDTVKRVLHENPELGSPGRVPGTRDFIRDGCRPFERL